MNNKIINAVKETLKIRKEMIETCIFLQKTGYFISTWGNISVRVENGFLLTPSRIDYAKTKPEDLVLMSWDGTKMKGHRLPSSEMNLHRLIFKKRQDLGAIIHTHSPYASAVACMRKTIPVITEEMSQIIGDEVRCTKYIPAGRHIAFAKEACETMGNLSTAVLLSNHGAVAGGRNLSEAVVVAQVLEKVSFIFINSEPIGGSKPIPDELIKEERHRFLYKYGKE